VSQGHRPLPRVLSIGVGLIALIEVVLSLADAGFIGDPTLRMRVFEAGAFWTGLLHGATARFAAQPATMFVSHALLHGGLLHMVMNLTILLALGRFVADRYGAGVIAASMVRVYRGFATQAPWLRSQEPTSPLSFALYRRVTRPTRTISAARPSTVPS
jgi:hypothetical protein